jgi:hypothetical protein
MTLPFPTYLCTSCRFKPLTTMLRSAMLSCFIVFYLLSHQRDVAHGVILNVKTSGHHWLTIFVNVRNEKIVNLCFHLGYHSSCLGNVVPLLNRFLLCLNSMPYHLDIFHNKPKQEGITFAAQTNLTHTRTKKRSGARPTKHTHAHKKKVRCCPTTTTTMEYEAVCHRRQWVQMCAHLPNVVKKNPPPPHPTKSGSG